MNGAFQLIVCCLQADMMRTGGQPDILLIFRLWADFRLNPALLVRLQRSAGMPLPLVAERSAITVYLGLGRRRWNGLDTMRFQRIRIETHLSIR